MSLTWKRRITLSRSEPLTNRLQAPACLRCVPTRHLLIGVDLLINCYGFIVSLLGLIAALMKGSLHNM